MKFVKVTTFIEGEAISEEVPLFCVPLLRWLSRKLGGAFICGPVRDTRAS